MNAVNSVAQRVSRLEVAVIALRRLRPSQARGVGPKGKSWMCSWGIRGTVVWVLMAERIYVCFCYWGGIEPEEAFCDQDAWSLNGCSCFVESMSFC